MRGSLSRQAPGALLKLSSLLPAHRHAVDAAELEAAHGEPGKYTEGLMMREWSACDEDEDVVTMALTAVRRLIERCGVRWEDIGMLQVGSTLCVCYCSSSLRKRLQHALCKSCACAAHKQCVWTAHAHATHAQVGSESLLDRSKSIKSHLMALFPPGRANVEGVDAYQACYGGTAALLACTNWVGSEAWDGRWALCVCTDVSDAPAQYPFMNGAACVAMLVGADAPLALEGRRRTHMAHAWDFYKPVGWPSMGPIIDGPGSIELYHKSLAACQARHRWDVYAEHVLVHVHAHANVLVYVHMHVITRVQTTLLR